VNLPPLSLYVHFPWCVRKCPYCDFNSYALRGELPEASYLDTLLADLALEAPRALGRSIGSIFFGGGTPSLFSPEAFGRLLAGCRRLLVLESDCEITLEANPGTIERGRFAEYRAAGITRVSLGAQSFSDTQLAALGRIHGSAQIREAAEELHAAGVSNFNLDLMYALPGQTAAQACADLQAALELSPAHLSHYQLTPEPGTPFGAHVPTGLPDEDASADMQGVCQARLAAAGYARYEISAYAPRDARCRHNLNYWRFGDYLGIGAGAHGKCTQWQGGRIVVERTVKPRDPRRYRAAIERDVPAEAHRVAVADLPFEFMMNALRLSAGFEPSEYEARTGLPFAPQAARLERLAAQGLTERLAGAWRASERGLELLNELLTEWLPPASRSPSPRQRASA
jgi:oxygen-independent coproporphyrinogen-3 oxidase